MVFSILFVFFTVYSFLSKNGGEFLKNRKSFLSIREYRNTTNKRIVPSIDKICKRTFTKHGDGRYLIINPLTYLLITTFVLMCSFSAYILLAALFDPLCSHFLNFRSVHNI